MKYWAFLVAKFAAVALVLAAGWDTLNRVLPEPDTVLHYHVSRFPQDLRWTTVMLVFWLVSLGLAYVAIWDQKRRCRTCLRRLRMPIETGSWGLATLLSPPQVESICPYGHGTLKEPEVHVTGAEPTQWKSNGDDIWKELETLDREK